MDGLIYIDLKKLNLACKEVNKTLLDNEALFKFDCVTAADLINCTETWIYFIYFF